ncbi:hypothetical protein [Pseudomonas fluorescens]|uniref:hypothetical protein n=1 Tax=Pseudomonas TaxID=286 RepID=UPI001240C909|nr:hypothetical protein [Pseudomonas fluorescens]VVM81818.1 hypothetical protein PS676_02307 [Pseudomonas fluorescens]
MVEEKTLTNDETTRIRTLLASGMTQRAVHRETGLSRRQIAKVGTIETADDNPFSDEPERLTKAAAAKAIHALSIRPQGVKNSELSSILAAHFGFRRNKNDGSSELNMSDGQLSYLKKKSRETQALYLPPLFIPEWMPRQTPITAFKTLLEHASHLQDRISEIVLEFCSAYPESSTARVYEELICIAIKQATKEPVERRCERNMAAAEALQSRLGPTSVSLAIRQTELISDDEIDALCI